MKRFKPKYQSSSTNNGDYKSIIMQIKNGNYISVNNGTTKNISWRVFKNVLKGGNVLYKDSTDIPGQADVINRILLKSLRDNHLNLSEEAIFKKWGINPVPKKNYFKNLITAFDMSDI